MNHWIPSAWSQSHRLLAGAMLFAVLCSALEVHAGARALLIGVGQYQSGGPLQDLPGIDVDIDNIRQVAEVMAFQTEQIRILRDQDATADRIRSEIRQWLIDGTQPGDRVMLYFSGHGVRVPDAGVLDEPDGYDEALAGHDLRIEDSGSERTVAGIVRDDELYDLLRQLKGREVMVILDACHSGTATRAGATSPNTLSQTDDGWVRKGGALGGSAPNVQSRASIERHWHARRAAQHWISLAAAEDTQSAYATPHGSLFTQALHSVVLSTRREQARLPLDDLRSEMAKQLRQRLGKEPWVPLPVLDGPQATLAKGIRLTDPSAARPVRARLEALAVAGERQLVQAPQRQYAIGEPVLLEVTAPNHGYLNLITVDAHDQPRLLFPNAWHPENRLSAGQTLTLGAPVLGFRLEASRPAGESYLLAVFTEESQPLNFYREALAEFGERAGVDRGLAKLSSTAMLRAKGIRVTPLPSAYTAQGLMIVVGENDAAFTAR